MGAAVVPMHVPLALAVNEMRNRRATSVPELQDDCRETFL